jgi:hypothetical protein
MGLSPVSLEVENAFAKNKPQVLLLNFNDPDNRARRSVVRC